jgi:hypothetical protein
MRFRVSVMSICGQSARPRAFGCWHDVLEAGFAVRCICRRTNVLANWCHTPPHWRKKCDTLTGQGENDMASAQTNKSPTRHNGAGAHLLGVRRKVCASPIARHL